MRARQRTGFPSPFEVTIPPDCEGWEEMYARHAVFGEARRGFEESRFWFQDGLHAAEPLYPFDSFAVRVRRGRNEPGELTSLRRAALPSASSADS